MKKSIKITLLAILSLLIVFAFAGCNTDTSEIAGTYEMTSMSGTVNGTSVTEANYAYYRIIIDDKGNAKVQAKGAGVGGSEYESTGKVTYSDGVIKLKSGVGCFSATEEMQYKDGVITYVVNNSTMNFTLILERAEG